jgi:hypothetical protein
VVECLLSKREALNSNSSTTEKTKATSTSPGSLGVLVDCKETRGAHEYRRCPSAGELGLFHEPPLAIGMTLGEGAAEPVYP